MEKHYAGMEDLLSDETFLSWYFKTDEESTRLWEQWIAEDAGLRSGSESAVAFLRSLTWEELPPDAERSAWAESRLMSRIATEKSGAGDPSSASSPLMRKSLGDRPRINRRRYWIAAASVILVIAGALGGWHLLNRKDQLQTAFGEIRSQRLPDGTEIMVNANSQIIWSPSWKDGSDREVWMKGEAFFHVAKTPMKSRFIVHTHRCDIVVTGTQFNVVDRPGKTNILLEEGSVTLLEGNKKAVQMYPGDFVEFTGSGSERRVASADSVTAWKEHMLVFKGTPLRELIQIIREQYGVTVELENERLGNKTVYGMLSNENLDILLKSLSTTGEYKVKRMGDRILIQDSTR
jgi:ferric-dicitrate binding protein FerR (iron transport regulator)